MEPDGMPAGRGYEASRPQHVAMRCRVGGNPHGYGPHRWTEYATGRDIEGDDLAEIVADELGPDAPFLHLIDLTTAGPYGGRPLP